MPQRMKNKYIKRIVSLGLSIVTIASLLTGCKESVEVPTLVPAEQMQLDEYDLNEDITKMLTKTYDYTRNNTESFYLTNENMNVLPLFNHMKIQVDNWESMIIGRTTMGGLVEIIENANDNYVKTKTQEIIDARQKIIDDEYNAAKKAAEEKGKTYDKPKKQVRTDDIVFEKPYTYQVAIQRTNTSTAEGDISIQEYEPTRLVDPQKNKTMFLHVSKYGIPYVRFEFTFLQNLYNTRITQESDWVCNGVKAADISTYFVDEKEQTKLEFVDKDNLNKAAKDNIVMSGNIAFGGAGFDWESLQKLFSALEWEYQDPENGFTESSDNNFTYYTISFYTNPFEFGDAKERYTTANNTLQIPMTRLVATFDPLKQNCVNWTIDMYGKTKPVTNRKHELAEPINIDAHAYQVDTNNYAMMRETIDKWIEENAEPLTTAYCAFDSNGKLYGIVENGLSNLEFEAMIDGELYECLDYEWDINKESMIGTFISQEKRTNIEMSDSDNKEAELAKESIQLSIQCCLMSGKETVFTKFKDSQSPTVQDNEHNSYYVISFDKTESGYKNIKIMSESKCNELLMNYTKTYNLTDEQNNVVFELFQTSPQSARDYINDLFKDAEEAQKEQNILPDPFDKEEPNDEHVDNKTDLKIYQYPITTIEDINTLMIGNEKYPIMSLFNTAEFKRLPIEKTEKTFIGGNDYYKINAKTYVDAKKNELEIGSTTKNKPAIYTKNESYLFFRDIHAGMPVSEVLEKTKDLHTFVNEDDKIIINSKNGLAMIIELDMGSETVSAIAILDINYQHQQVEVEDSNAALS